MTTNAKVTFLKGERIAIESTYNEYFKMAIQKYCQGEWKKIGNERWAWVVAASHLETVKALVQWAYRGGPLVLNGEQVYVAVATPAPVVLPAVKPVSHEYQDMVALAEADLNSRTSMNGGRS